jgi:uncharacterized protein YihD (DUF1040 family)
MEEFYGSYSGSQGRCFHDLLLLLLLLLLVEVGRGCKVRGHVLVAIALQLNINVLPKCVVLLQEVICPFLIILHIIQQQGGEEMGLDMHLEEHVNNVIIMYIIKLIESATGHCQPGFMKPSSQVSSTDVMDMRVCSSPKVFVKRLCSCMSKLCSTFSS